MIKNPEFVARFIEACGTDEPAKIQQLLDIPYQSAKNYLQGRLPKSEKLIAFAERTSCSIHWLLTGRGEKFDLSLRTQYTPPATGQMESFVRRVCVEVFNELNGSLEAAQPKVVKLQSSELLSEKVAETSPALNGSQP